MSPSTQSTITSALLMGLLAGRSTNAQKLQDTIVGCDVVDCPISDASTAAECQVQDYNYTTIGLSRVSDKQGSLLNGLSWVEGVSVVDGDNEERTFSRNFYLGAPADYATPGANGCALFFERVSERVAFDGENQRTAQGTCDDAMSESCVAALNRRAAQFDASGSDVGEICSQLGQDFLDNLDDACRSFADGNGWGKIVAKPLTGSDAAEPIESGRNSSSTCWPIVPKSNDLRLVQESESTGDFDVTTLEEKLFGITPILTVFFPTGGNNTVESQMTCMKTLPQNDATNETEDNEDENVDRPEAAGTVARPALSLLMGGALVVLLAGIF